MQCLVVPIVVSCGYWDLHHRSSAATRLFSIGRQLRPTLAADTSNNDNNG